MQYRDNDDIIEHNIETTQREIILLVLDVKFTYSKDEIVLNVLRHIT
jgi:hypothetical protein